jgi:hypothetical protein
MLNFVLRCHQLLLLPILVIGSIILGAKFPTQRKRWDYLTLGALFTFPAGWGSVALLHWLAQITPLKYDQYIFYLDSFFGEPSFAVGQYLTHHLWLKDISWCAYSALLDAYLIVFVVYVWLRSEHETIQVVRTLLLNLFLAMPIYCLIPVCGPRYAFPTFPFTVPAHLLPHPITLLYPPNGIPSVHTSSVLLICWFLRHWRIGFLLSVTFLTLIIIATLGSGEHYLFDLLAAIPYTAAIWHLDRIEWNPNLWVRNIPRQHSGSNR